MSVTHQYVSTAPAVAGKVDSTEWNRDHTVSITNAEVAAAAAIAESKLALNYATHADETAASILAKLITVDGAGSLLDADFLDGNSSAAFEAAGTAASLISDAAYGVGWDTDATHAPSKNAVYDKFNSLGGGGDISGTGVVGQVAEFVTDTKTIQAAKIIGPAANILTLTNAAASTLALNITAAKTLTLTAADNYTVTVPASLTVAGLAIANVFTKAQQVANADAVANGRASLEVIPTGGVLPSDLGAPYAFTIASPSGTIPFAFKQNAAESITPLLAEFQTSGGRLGFISARTNTFCFGAATSKSLALYGGGNKVTPDMTINTASNVGIGVASASVTAHLHIVGIASDIQQLLVVGYTTQSVSQTLVQFTRNDAAAGISAMLGLTALGSGANGDGGSISLAGKSSTTAATAMGLIDWRYIDATHASRKAAMRFYAYDTAARLGLEIEASGTAAKLSFYGGTTVARGAALTTQLTTITFTAPGTPDYALQDVTNITPYGFADAEEARTFISVVKNLQTRCAELEARLGSATGVNLFI